MHTHNFSRWQHAHVFQQVQLAAGEKRTLIIVLLTALMMVVEIVAGLAYGSMALLADGLHMASHATALGITLLAYIAARRFCGRLPLHFWYGKSQ